MEISADEETTLMVEFDRKNLNLPDECLCMDSHGGAMHYVLLAGVGGLILTAVLLSGYGLVAGKAGMGMALTSASHIGGGAGRDISFIFSINESAEIEGEFPDEDCIVHLKESHTTARSTILDQTVNQTFLYLTEAENLDEVIECDVDETKEYKITKEDGVVTVEA
ncbi:MAG: hypothetical protein ACLFTQ_00780 [Candidatus Aenigmatarchaeota archaeon]